MAVTIQIFGKAKCFDTKKAQRYFKERNVNFQFIDFKVKGMSAGELKSVISAVGGIENIIDEKSKDYFSVKYLLDDAKFEKLLDNPALIKTPIVRCSKKACVGYRPEIWETYIAK